MTFKEFLNKAVTVPFVEKGRDYDGWDCWGSVYRCYQDVLGITLPVYLEYDSTKEYEQIHRIIAGDKHIWQQIVHPHPMDVALFTISKYSTHVALMVDRRYALHAEQKLGTFIEPIDAVIWRKRLEGIYRYPCDG